MSSNPSSSVAMRRVLGFESTDDIDHYSFLGIERFESDKEIVARAIDVRFEKLNAIIDGPDLPVAQECLNRLARIRLCLLNEESKSKYDHELRSNDGLESARRSTNSTTAIDQTIDTGETNRAPVIKVETEECSSVSVNDRPAMRWGVVGLSAFVLVALLSVFWPRGKEPTTTDIGDAKKQPIAPSQNVDHSLPSRPALTAPKVASNSLVWIDASQLVTQSKEWRLAVRQLATGLNFEVLNRRELQVSRERALPVLRFDKSAVLRINGSEDRIGQDFTIVFIGSGDGILISKGDPYEFPSQAFEFLNKGHMRLRIGQRRYLATKVYASDEWIPRVVVCKNGQLEFHEGEKKSTSAEPMELNQEFAITIGARSSSRKSRERQDRFQGDIGELLIFDQSLDSRQLNELVTYLRKKWK